MNTAPAYERVPDLEVTSLPAGDAIVRRPDGRRWRLSGDSAWLLEEIRLGRSLDHIAAQLSQRFASAVNEAAVRTLVLTTLVEPGLVRVSGTTASPSAAQAERVIAMLIPAPLVAMTARVASPLARRPLGEVIAALGLAGAGALLARASLLDPSPWSDPAAWLGAMALTLVSFIAHELGHAAALAAGGGVPGSIALVWRRHAPAFRLDVRDASRLDRSARLRLDLGGVVAQIACVALAVGVSAWGFGSPAAPVLAVPLLLALHQLLPHRGSDGDWWVADIADTTPTGSLGWRPQAATPSARAALLAHAIALGLAALGVTWLAARLGQSAWDAWRTGVGWGNAVTALAAWGLGAHTLGVGLGLLNRARRRPERAGTIRTRVSLARQLRSLLTIARTRIQLAIGQHVARTALHVMPNLLAESFPTWSGARRARLVRSHWVATVLTSADHADLPRGGAADEIRHPEPVRALIAARQGAVVCGLHLGPFYYPAQSLCRLGANVTAFSAAHIRSDQGFGWQQARARLPGDFEAVLAGDPRGALRAMRALREGRLVFILIDGQIAAQRDSASHRTTARIGHSEMWVRTAAAEIARRAGVPLLLAASFREGATRRVVEFSDLIAPPTSGDAGAIAEATRAMFRWFEPYVLAHPEQWPGWAWPILHWRQTGAAPTASRADLDAAIARARAAIDAPRGRARLVTDPTRVGWIEADGERFIVHGVRRRVLAGDALSCALIDQARASRAVRELPRRVGAPAEAVAAMLARLELAGLARIEER